MSWLHGELNGKPH